jgi:hypothetical protein
MKLEGDASVLEEALSVFKGGLGILQMLKISCLLQGKTFEYTKEP